MVFRGSPITLGTAYFTGKLRALLAHTPRGIAFSTHREDPASPELALSQGVWLEELLELQSH